MSPGMEHLRAGQKLRHCHRHIQERCPICAGETGLDAGLLPPPHPANLYDDRRVLLLHLSAHIGLLHGTGHRPL